MRQILILADAGNSLFMGDFLYTNDLRFHAGSGN